MAAVLEVKKDRNVGEKESGTKITTERGGAEKIEKETVREHFLTAVLFLLDAL